jgi:protein MpaA
MRTLVLAVSALLGACVYVEPEASNPDPVNVDDAGSSGGATIGEDWAPIGRSVEGRAIRARVVGRGPRRVLLIGGIHGNEREGSYAAGAIAGAFLESPDLAAGVTLAVVEDLNPDGSAARTRGNAHGVDLNRNFPASNRRPDSPALTEPEARALQTLVSGFEPHAVIVLHSWGAKPSGPRQFINYDGPGDELAYAFSALNRDYPVEESRNLPATPGSLGSWIGVDMQIPIFTIEYRRGIDPEDAWRSTRDGLLALVRG